MVAYLLLKIISDFHILSKENPIYLQKFTIERSFLQVLKAFKYELFPTPDQAAAFEKHFGCSRFIYNWGLENRIKAHSEGKKTSCLDLAYQLPELKKQHPWLAEVNSQSLQMPLRNLDNAFTLFFKHNTQFPKFKSKHRSKPKFQCPQHVKVDFESQTVSLVKIPNIRFALDRTFEGDIKTTTVSKTPTGRYFISILVENNESLPLKPAVDPETTVGIDLGLKDFCVDSDGNKTPNPKYFRKSEQRLKRNQRRLSKKKKGSKSYQQQRLKVARIHERIVNQRKDFLNKLSTELIRENQSICLEDLAVGNMLKNHCLAKSISDAAWTEFKRQLEYKGEWYGRNILTIGRFEPSSKTCSVCGLVKKDLTLADREWVCSCGAKHDRDVNAAINIKKFALTNLKLHLGEPGQSIKKASRRSLGRKTKSCEEKKPTRL